MSNEPSFSTHAFSKVSSIMNAIYAHSFIKELTCGTLSLNKFIFYMQQDALYLIDFSKALAIVASRLENPEDIAAFLGFAQGAILAERSLHHDYFKLYQATDAQEKSPACLMYTTYLLSLASVGELTEAIAALLPCFWIYREVGKHIISQPNVSNNPYAKWIEMYSGEEFDNVVDSAITIMDRLATIASLEQKEKMLKAFIKSSEMEFKFWDSAYNLEQKLY